jgi:glycosyltransferase involved in cell wall biosynthesis
MSINHTILMITYNQEEYVSSALDCLFRQGVYPFEVIISDDCSTDKTQEIILEYQKRYPNIIKPIFQKKNLGIYQNLNYILNSTKVEGDIVSFLSGDDIFKDNMLVTFNEYVANHNLNPLTESFLLITNTLNLTPSGKEVEQFNNFKSKGKNYTKLRVRNKIGNRYTGISKALFKTMEPWNLELGLWVDALHSFDMYMNCKNFYFINKSFPVYRLGSGVTSTSDRFLLGESWVKTANYMLTNRSKYLDKRDVIHIKKSIQKSRLELNNTLSNRLLFIKFYFLSFGDVLDGSLSFKQYLIEIYVLVPMKIKRILRK